MVAELRADPLFWVVLGVPLGHACVHPVYPYHPDAFGDSRQDNRPPGLRIYPPALPALMKACVD
jgi:hypothetical protein